MRTCPTCNTEKDLSEFHRCKRSKQGRYYQCKSCKLEYNKRPSGHRVMEDYRSTVKARTSKICPWCKTEKKLEQYHKNKRTIDGLTNHCASCLRERGNKRYQSTGDAKARMSRDARKLDLINILGGSCCHCGLTPSEEWPLACFDFHHNGDKTAEPARLLQLKSEAAINRATEEIKKCIVLCGNCHKRHHSNESRSKFNGLVISPFQNNIVASKPQ